MSGAVAAVIEACTNASTFADEAPDVVARGVPLERTMSAAMAQPGGRVLSTRAFETGPGSGSRCLDR